MNKKADHVEFLKNATVDMKYVNGFLRQYPLGAILVIFGRRALIFFCLKALGKK